MRYLLLFWPLRLRLGSPYMSFYGSALLYAECVGSNIGVSTACFDSDQANQTKTRIEIAISTDLRTNSLVPSISCNIRQI